MSDAEAPDIDTSADVTIPPDLADAGPEKPYGEPCDDDAVCDALSCIEGVCTSPCATDAECGGGTRCTLSPPMGICLLSCDARSCAPGLACTASREGCLPDADSDAIADVEDNCPGQANITQLDLDGDSIGDACDPEPACADGHVDGVLSRGPLAYAATQASLPEYATNWIVAAGGRDANGDLVALLAQFGGAPLSMLPYPAQGFGAAQLNDNEFVLTPGDLGVGVQFGRMLHVFRDGTVQQGAVFEGPSFEPVMSASPGGLVYVARTSAATSSYDFVRFDAATARFEVIGGADDGAPVRWHVTRDRQGVSIFYSEIVDVLTLTAHYAIVGPDATTVTVGDVVYPDVNGTFDPLLSPAPGGGVYAWDRNTGRGFAWDANGFREVPELAVSTPLTSAKWLSQPSGPGLHMVGYDDVTQTLSATSISVACLPAVQALDTDGDGVIDPLDLCPTDPASSGPDLDMDGIGDGCDADADGDGIPDAIDPSLLDSDNDGVTNDLDDDDDADGIADALDRWALDTDNDGIVNAVDSDDDDDGWPDADELNRGTNPLDPLSFPRSGNVAWFESGLVKVAPLRGLSGPEVLRASPIPLTSVRWTAAADGVVFVPGPSGTVTHVEYIGVSGAPVVFIEVGETVWGVDAVSEDVTGPARLLVSSGASPDMARLGWFDVLGQTLEPLVPVLAQVQSPDFSGGRIAFTAQPQGCDTCRSSYLLDVSGTFPRIVAPMVSNPSTIRYNGGAITLIGEATDGNGGAAWFGDPANPMELRPPGAIDVTAAVGYPDGSVLLAATGTNGHALWFYSGAKARWTELVATDEPVTELDWAR